MTGNLGEGGFCRARMSEPSTEDIAGSGVGRVCDRRPQVIPLPHPCNSGRLLSNGGAGE